MTSCAEVPGYLDPFKKLRSGQGALAEYLKIAVRRDSKRARPNTDCCIQSNQIVSKPAKLSWSEAAGLPIVGLTAYEGIVKRGKVAAGERVFINGGSSSVGAMAIQIAKQRGAVVVTSCSAAKREFVEGLGADLVSPNAGILAMSSNSCVGRFSITPRHPSWHN